MKKTITKPDGTTEVLEGTAEEIREYERTIPIVTPIVPTPGIPIGGFFKPTHINPECYVHNSRAWFGVIPPKCTCLNGISGYGTYTTSESSMSSPYVLGRVDKAGIVEASITCFAHGCDKHPDYKVLAIAGKWYCPEHNPNRDWLAEALASYR